MAKKKGAGKDKAPSKPKRLRKQLHRAEARLVKAEAKRDKAQARVEAMSIIADEIRAQIAESEKVAKSSATPPGDPAKPKTSLSAVTGGSSRPASRQAPTKSAARTAKRRPAASASKSASPEGRRTSAPATAKSTRSASGKSTTSRSARPAAASDATSTPSSRRKPKDPPSTKD